MFNWLKRAREDRQTEETTHFGPPYASDLHELSELLRTNYETKRIRPGHA